MIEIYALIILFMMSMFMNVLLFLLYRKASSKGKPENTIELQDFISDLLNRGGGVLHVTRMDPENIFYHNIKGR